MKNTLQELLEFILNHGDRFLKFIKECGAFINELGSHLGNIVLEIPKSAKASEFILAFALVVGAAFIIILVCVSIHLILMRCFKRKTKVFISYHHQRESDAQEISDSMALTGIKVVRLPFIDRPDHDELLEKIRNEIHDSDILICVPGDQTSFVDNEVSMAFALSKPLILVASPNEVFPVPNTAKKGYPIFLIDELRQRKYRPLVGLCSYLSSDLRSTLDIYKSALNHISACGGIVLTAFLMQLALIFFLDPDFIGKVKDIKVESWSLLTEQTMGILMSVPMAVLLLPYTILITMRFGFRNRFGRMVSGMRFTEDSIPESLGYSFFKADVSGSLFRGEVRAHHEIPATTVAEPTNPADRYNTQITLQAARIAEQRACEVHKGKCPMCGKDGPIDIVSSYLVLSYGVACETSETESISCRKCGIRKQLIGICYCFALGWWSIQGLLYTPLQIIRNVLAILNPPHPAYPSARLIQVHTPKIKLRRKRRNTSGYCPRCTVKLSEDALDCPYCGWQL